MRNPTQIPSRAECVIGKLAAVICEKAKPRKNGRDRLLGDADGLCPRIRPHRENEQGIKTWVVEYSDPARCKADAATVAALQVVILTGEREREVTDASSTEFNLTADVWAMPPGRTKSGRAHLVHLAPRQVALTNWAEEIEALATNRPQAGAEIIPLHRTA